MIDINSIEEQERQIWGSVRVYRKIWDKLGLTQLVKRLLKGRRIKFDLFSAVFLMLLDRLGDPKSKLKSYQEQEGYYGIVENELQHLYRALDILAEGKEEIEQYLFQRNRNLFNMQVNVVLYDVTSLYFESIKADQLKDFGFSKDGKSQEVQVLLGLLLDMQGRPIGFDIFPGNRFEGHTLKTALAKLEERFGLNRVIMVADQGMLSRQNIAIIQKAGFEYVMGGRIKSRQRFLQEQVLDPQGYQEVLDEEGEEIFRYKELACQEDKRIIATWSPKRQRRQQKERERLVQKAEKLVAEGKSQVISRRGAKRYLKVNASKVKGIDQERIESDQRWDGYYSIETNCPNLSERAIIGIYHDLWRVEQAFRILKSHLEARPVFHWTPQRIKGHLVLCFIAFVMERTLELELKEHKIEYSADKIRQALNQLQVSKVVIDQQTYCLRSLVKGLGNQILRALGIKIPPTICLPQDF